jgi:hypothetical protein
MILSSGQSTCFKYLPEIITIVVVIRCKEQPQTLQTTTGGTAQSRRGVERIWIDFHYPIWHTAASILLNQGVPVIAVSRRLGHAKASITLDIYGHLIPTMQTEVAEMIDDLVMPVTVQLDKKVEPDS